MFTKKDTKVENLNVVEYSTENGVAEYFVIFRTPETHQLADSLNLIWENYEKFRTECSNKNLLPVYTRFFLSDVENQCNQVTHSKIYGELSRGAVRLVGNEPLDSGLISIMAYFISGNTIEEQDNSVLKNSSVLQGNSYKMSYYADLGDSEPLCPEKQTDLVFSSLNKASNSEKINKELLRTWVSVRDVDNNYMPFVKSRKDFFKNVGIESFFPASTGVEGRSADPSKLINVDALCISGLKESQIVKMEALKSMPSTLLYGVTFERGLKLCFGDRSHYHISGTASIDHKGDVTHIGDIEKQVHCAINNINELLKKSDISFDHLAYLIFYIRDAKTINIVKEIAEKTIPENVPKLYIRSSICRPQWLMEIDGVALGKGDPKFAPFI